jgi:hypothetical protein
MGLENRDYGRGDPSRWPRDTLYPLKLALTSGTGCGRSVGIVRLRTKATEFSLYKETWDIYGDECQDYGCQGCYTLQCGGQTPAYLYA